MNSTDKFVTIKKIAEETGLTEEAIRQYIKKGRLRIQTHFVKGANNRIMIKEKAFYQWIEQGV